MKVDRKRKTKAPCLVCGLNSELCICSQIKKIKVSTKLLLVIHAKELKRTTNSGRIAVAALENSELLIRGQIGNPLELTSVLTEEYESILFFPTEDAVELSEDFITQIKKPIQLIVPDGNWRQASKVAVRHKEFSQLKKVMIKEKNLAQFHLRKETSEFGMSTLEAIAKAFGVIEGPDIEKQLQALYQLKLKNTLKGRGIVY